MAATLHGYKTWWSTGCLGARTLRRWEQDPMRRPCRDPQRCSSSPKASSGWLSAAARLPRAAASGCPRAGRAPRGHVENVAPAPLLQWDGGRRRSSPTWSSPPLRGVRQGRRHGLRGPRARLPQRTTSTAPGGVFAAAHPPVRVVALLRWRRWRRLAALSIRRQIGNKPHQPSQYAKVRHRDEQYKLSTCCSSATRGDERQLDGPRGKWTAAPPTQRVVCNDQIPFITQYAGDAAATRAHGSWHEGHVRYRGRAP